MNLQSCRSEARPVPVPGSRAHRRHANLPALARAVAPHARRRGKGKPAAQVPERDASCHDRHSWPWSSTATSSAVIDLGADLGHRGRRRPHQGCSDARRTPPRRLPRCRPVPKASPPTRVPRATLELGPATDGRPVQRQPGRVPCPRGGRRREVWLPARATDARWQRPSLCGSRRSVPAVQVVSRRRHHHCPTYSVDPHLHRWTGDDSCSGLRQPVLRADGDVPDRPAGHRGGRRDPVGTGHRHQSCPRDRRSRSSSRRSRPSSSHESLRAVRL